jgi:exopolysaccharide production protein ExoY
MFQLNIELEAVYMLFHPLGFMLDRQLEAKKHPHFLGSDIRVRHIPPKRIFDVCFSLGALIVTFPLIFLLGIMIKTTSRGPLIYSHKRLGRGGRAFPCYKFRTMYEDADQRLEELLKSSPETKEEWEKTFKLKHDPRVTPFGRFLRRTSLDELPQFFNVLIGDLSVVGPRPIVEEEASKFYGKQALKILSIRPGLTGLWQVSGRSNTTYRERVSLDLTYLKTRSLGLDLKLIAQTIPAMISSRGAY